MTDVTLPWAYDHFAFLIPVPDETANINAVVKPFQWPVTIINYFLENNVRKYRKIEICFLSSDLVGTWRFHHLRHRNFKFNATRIVLPDTRKWRLSIAI